MKKLINYTLLVLSISIASLNSCKDPCKDVNCINGGACNDGECTCPQGYSGEFCEIEDPCLSTNCQNGGTCVSGNCNCPPRYSGTNCQIDNCEGVPCVNGTIPSTSENCECECDPGYFGSDCSQNISILNGYYSVYEDCLSGTYTFTCGISFSSNIIIIDNFGDYGVTIQGTVNSSGEINIPSQTESSITFSGYGNINPSGSVISITYLATSGTDSDNCEMTCTPQ